jgi:hypothetical protein
MTIFPATMTAIVLAILPAAGQDVRRPGKTAHQSTHAKKRTQVGSQAKPAAPRAVSGSEGWMDRAGSNSSGGGGGGY